MPAHMAMFTKLTEFSCTPQIGRRPSTSSSKDASVKPRMQDSQIEPVNIKETRRTNVHDSTSTITESVTIDTNCSKKG
jgi:hypothetical protein